MSSLSRELVFLILQFLDEEKFKETVHKLEQESGFYFNMKHFEESVLNGEWDEVEKYLSGFTKVDDNRYSMKIFFEIRKQKYLEALDKRDRSKAVDILVKDLKVFSNFNEDLFKEITHLLTLENFRENEQLSKYGDTKSARGVMLVELKKLIEANPLFREKLQFPNLKNSRLRTLINQSLNWQHQLCKNPRQNPDIKTLFYDHSCSQPNGARAPSPAPPLMNMIQKPGGGFPPMGPHGPFQPSAAAPITSSLAGWMANTSNAVAPMAHQAMPGAVSGAPLGLAIPHTAALLKRPLTPNNPGVDYHTADSEHVLKRQRPMGISEEVSVPTNLPVGYPGMGRNAYSTEELPKNVATVLNQGSSVMSMDFHPSQPTVLLVGTNVGDIAVWEVACRERLAHRTFKVWEVQACSSVFQSALVKDPGMSVNRVLWNPDGNQFGVAYSKHLLHLYNFNGREDLVHHLEIDAHVGGVNDIAFSQPNNKHCVVTCGDDKTIKVWDATTGALQFTFEGHEAPVYSICPHSKENIQFIFSTSVDGKIKAWLYDNGGSRVDYTAPGHWCTTTMAYSADGTRLFSCGTSKDGDSCIVEWNESEGSVKRTYSGFRRKSIGVVQFDTTKNRYLAVGDEFMVKFWDMDNTNLLTTADGGGELPASPRIRFNKFGSLLAVSTSDNSIKILANADGIQMLRSIESRSYNAARLSSEAITKTTSLFPMNMAGTSSAVADRGTPAAPNAGLPNGDSRILEDVKPRIVDESSEKSKIWKLTEINEPSQCCSSKLPDNLLLVKVARLIYTNAGSAILALSCNAVHKLWKWQKTERNTSGKATALVAPQLWQPASGILMTNDISDANPEESINCFALSKNDSYVMSASGGKISLFNMMTFKTMTTFTTPPPAATYLAFHPQDNNIIAIGMDDSSIQIYNVRVDEVKSKLRGHQKKITGLAFSNALNILVSSGADSQLCIWNTDGWEKKGCKYLQLPSGRVMDTHSETRVQFHHDQIHLLVVHETQLAIYDASKLECLKQWTPSQGSITHAVYSCDSQTIYASFADGSVCVFSQALKLRCRINPTAYLTSQPSLNVHPVVVAAHPSDPNQFALGLTDGSVHVLEPLESEGKWGTNPPAIENNNSSIVINNNNSSINISSNGITNASSSQPPSGNPSSDHQASR